MIALVINPVFWVCLFFVCMVVSSELVPAIKRFRDEQDKHPRFTDIPGHKTAKIVLCITVPGIVLSAIVFTGKTLSLIFSH